VKGTEEWERFATDVLGLQISERGSDGTLFLRMDEYHQRFILHPTGTDDLAYVGWMVARLEDLKAVEERVAKAGVRVERGTPAECALRKVVDMIKFQDPLGITVEVFYGLLLSEDPFYPGRPLVGRFVTGAQGLGHIVIGLAEHEMEGAFRFYTEVLGFKVSDIIDFELGGHQIHAVFFHCNPRHHSLAFGQIPFQTGRRLHHFMLQLESLDDVGIAYDLCRSKGIPLYQSLGRHTNDQMISFYMKTPSGFAVEYGAMGRTIDDESEWVVRRYTRASIWGHHLVQTS
jgi:extradiol dioxygenase